MYKTFIPKIFFVVVVLFVFIPRANAEVGLGISRYLFDLEVLPGQVHREELRVLNKSPNNPLPIHLQAVPWDLKEDSDDIEFITAEPALNAASWFRFKEVGTETVLRNFILDPGKEKKIAVEIEPPSDAQIKSYQVMVRFQSVLPEHYLEAGGTKLIPEIGALFFLKIPALGLDVDRTHYDAQIVAFSIEDENRLSLLERFFIQRAEAGFFDQFIKTFSIKIKNKGLYHFKSSGFIEIKNRHGLVVEKVPLPQRYLLSDRIRNIEIAHEEPAISIAEHGLFEALYFLVKKNLYMGPYTASLFLEIPENDPIRHTIGFWIVPWKFWAITLSLLFFTTIALYAMRNRIKIALRILFKNMPP